MPYVTFDLKLAQVTRPFVRFPFDFKDSLWIVKTFRPNSDEERGRCGWDQARRLG
jgi:hypothetical protein